MIIFYAERWTSVVLWDISSYKLWAAESVFCPDNCFYGNCLVSFLLVVLPHPGYSDICMIKWKTILLIMTITIYTCVHRYFHASFLTQLMSRKPKLSFCDDLLYDIHPSVCLPVHLSINHGCTNLDGKTIRVQDKTIALFCTQ